MPQGTNLSLGTQIAANLVNNNADPTSDENPIVQYTFNISNPAPIQYVIIGDGQLENPNERVEIAANATEFTHSLLANHEYHMRLIQKTGENVSLSNATYSKYNVVPAAGPGKGRMTQIESFDKALRITVDYNAFDKAVPTDLSSITFLLSEETNDDIFEITKPISDITIDTRFTLSNLDLSGQDVSFSNFLTYDINFFTTTVISGVKVNGPTSDASMATPLDLHDRPHLSQAPQTLDNFDGSNVTLIIEPPVDVKSGEIPVMDISSITLQAVLADEGFGTYASPNENIFEQVLTDSSFKTINNIVYTWNHSNFTAGSVFKFRVKYEHVNGFASVDANGNPLVYSGQVYDASGNSDNKHLYSEELTQTCFDQPTAILSDAITASSGNTGDSLTFTWSNATPNATVPSRYDLVLLRADGDHDVNLTIDASNILQTVNGHDSLSKEFTNLKNGVKYALQITQLNASPNTPDSFNIAANAVTSGYFQPTQAPGQMAKPALSQPSGASQPTSYNDGKLDLSWNLLMSDDTWEQYQLGGHDFKHYKLELLRGGVLDVSYLEQTVTTTSHTFTDLTNGTDYTARVTLVGMSDISNVSTEYPGTVSEQADAVAPIGPLGKPTQVVAAIDGDATGNESYRDIHITWQNPVDFGGADESDFIFDIQYKLNDTQVDINDQSITKDGAGTYLYVVDLSNLEPEDEITNIKVRVTAENPTYSLLELESGYQNATSINVSGHGGSAFDLSYTVYAQPEPPTNFQVAYSHDAASVTTIATDISRGEITLSWDPPTDNNGRPLSLDQIYEVMIYIGTDATGTLLDPNSVGYTTRTNASMYSTNVTPNKRYFATVAARNLAGYSNGSEVSINAITNPKIVNTSEFDILYDANTQNQHPPGIDDNDTRELIITFRKSDYLTRDDSNTEDLSLNLLVNGSLAQTYTFANMGSNEVELTHTGERITGDNITLQVVGNTKTSDNGSSVPRTSFKSTSKDIMGAAFSNSSESGKISMTIQSQDDFTSTTSGTVAVYMKDSSNVEISENIGASTTDVSFNNLHNNTAYYAVLNLQGANSMISEYSQFFMVTPQPSTILTNNVAISNNGGSGTLDVEITDFADDSNLLITQAVMRYKRHDESDLSFVEVTEDADSQISHTFQQLTGLDNGHVYHIQVKLKGQGTAIDPLTGVIAENGISIGDYSEIVDTESPYPKALSPILRKIERDNTIVTLFVESEGTNISQVHFIPGAQDGFDAITTSIDISGSEVSGDSDETQFNTEELQIVFQLTGDSVTSDALENYVAIIDATNGHAIVKHTYNQPKTLGTSDTHYWGDDTETNITVAN